MKNNTIFGWIFGIAMLSVMLCVAYEDYELTFPRSSVGERSVLMVVGRGSKVYGTNLENSLNELSKGFRPAGIIVACLAVFVGSLSNQSSNPAPASGTPPAEQEPRHR